MKPMTGESSCAIVRNAAGRILVVWSRRAAGWTLPGGKREPGETAEQAVVRELREETGVVCVASKLVLCAPHETRDGVFEVSVFEAEVTGEAREAEDCPITWLTDSELLAESPFAAFYAKVLER